jgi:hypothetical protein
MLKQIEVYFEDFKALTQCLRSADETLADVVHRLLQESADLEPVKNSHAPPPSQQQKGSGIWIKKTHLPDGTELKAVYKGSNYFATISAGRWVNRNGEIATSPSQAASAITGTNVNGWRFWFAKRPGDVQWRRLDMLG